MRKFSVEELRNLLLQARNKIKHPEKITKEDFENFSSDRYNLQYNIDEIIDALNLLNNLSSNEDTYESKIGEYPLRLTLEKLYSKLPDEFLYSNIILIKPKHVDIALFDAISISMSIIETKDNNVLIKTNSGLISSLAKISLIITKIVSFIISGKWEIRNIENHLLNSPLILKLLECFISCLFSEHISLLSDKLYPEYGVCSLDNEIEFDINSSLYFSTLSFVTAHELSHVMLNHFVSEPDVNKEYDADELAVFLLNNYMDISGLQGAILILETINIIENSRRLKGVYKATSHPSAMRRLDQIIDYYSSHISEKNNVNGLIIHEIFNVYWDTLGDFISFLESKGIHFDELSLKAESIYSTLLKLIYDDDGFCDYLLCR